jgi:hypothetical protein
MKIQSPVITALLIAALVVTQGCVVIPTPKVGNYPASRENVDEHTPGRFRVGVTTREEVLLALGEADYVSPDEEVMSYGWNKLAAVFFLMPVGWMGGGGPVPGRTRLLVISFDKAGVLRSCQLRDISPFSTMENSNAAMAVAPPPEFRLSTVRIVNLKVSYLSNEVAAASAQTLRREMDAALRADGLELRAGANAFTIQTTLLRVRTDSGWTSVEYSVLFRAPDQQVVARMTGRVRGAVSEPKKGLGKVIDRITDQIVESTQEELLRALGRRAGAEIMAFMQSDGQSQEAGKKLK